MNYQLKSREVRTEEQFGMHTTQTRYDICDANGKVLDDAQGYGYKTPQSAHKAAAYKFKGGQQKADSAKAFWRENKKFAAEMTEMFELNFKEPISNQEIVAFAEECGFPNFDPKLIKWLP